VLVEIAVLNEQVKLLYTPESDLCLSDTLFFSASLSDSAASVNEQNTGLKKMVINKK
jgi:hypothetical protein